MDLAQFLKTIGLFGIFAMIFAESGLLIGFFFPGDSALFTAGFLASQGFFDIKVLAIGCFIAAVLGDSAGYAFGKNVGRRLFTREDSLLFHKDNLIKAEKFYEKHGKKTIILARFIPFVRTFAPIVAGIGKMTYPTFLSFNIIGGALWALGISYAGYFLGKSIPNVDKYLLPVVFTIILASTLPTFIHLLKDEKRRKDIINILKKGFNIS